MKIDPILRSIVGVRSLIPEDAFTATTLGTVREGSGVVIRESGVILTIGYLITEANEVWLTTPDGKAIAGHVLAYDQTTGFGLVQALGRLDLPSVELGDSAKAGIGDPVLFTDSAGMSVNATILAKQEFAGYWEYLLDEAIFTSPAHPSWGGAALIGDDGRLLGIGSLRMQMAQNGEVADINMSVPINLLSPIFDDLLTRGQSSVPPRPWLGVFAAESTGEVVVMSVAKGSPAAEAGLRRRRCHIGHPRRASSWPCRFLSQAVGERTCWSRVPMRISRDGRYTWLRIKSADRNSFLKKPQLQ